VAQLAPAERTSEAAEGHCTLPPVHPLDFGGSVFAVVTEVCGMALVSQFEVSVGGGGDGRVCVDKGSDNMDTCGYIQNKCAMSEREVSSNWALRWIARVVRLS